MFYIIVLIFFINPVVIEAQNCSCDFMCVEIKAAITSLNTAANILNGAVQTLETEIAYLTELQAEVSDSPEAVSVIQQTIVVLRTEAIAYRASAIAARATVLSLSVKCNADECCRSCCNKLYDITVLNEIFDPDKPLPTYEPVNTIQAIPIGCKASNVSSNSTTSGRRLTLW